MDRPHLAPQEWLSKKRKLPGWARLLLLILLFVATVGLCVWAPWEAADETEDNCKVFAWNHKGKTTWSVCCEQEGEDTPVVQCQVMEVTGTKASLKNWI